MSGAARRPSALQAALAALLVIQGAAIAWRWAGDAARDDAEGGVRKLLAGVDFDKVDRVTVRGASEAIAVRLRREAVGWELEEPDGFPADSGRVEELLRALSGAEVRRPVVRGSRYHDALGVADEKAELSITLSGGDLAREVLVGTSPNYGVRHARLAGDDRVFELSGIDPIRFPPRRGAWLRHDLVAVAAGSIDRISLVNGLGRFAFERADGGTWMSIGAGHEGLTPNAERIEGLVERAVGLSIEDVAVGVPAAEEGLADPVAAIEISWREGEAQGATGTATIRLGRQTDDGGRYASATGIGWTVVVPAWQTETLLETGSEQLFSDGG